MKEISDWLFLILFLPVLLVACWFIKILDFFFDILDSVWRSQILRSFEIMPCSCTCTCQLCRFSVEALIPWACSQSNLLCQCFLLSWRICDVFAMAVMPSTFGITLWKQLSVLTFSQHSPKAFTLLSQNVLAWYFFDITLWGFIVKQLHSVYGSSEYQLECCRPGLCQCSSSDYFSSSEHLRHIYYIRQSSHHDLRFLKSWFMIQRLLIVRSWYVL